MAFDWLVRGGTVLDGTGGPGGLADVGLTGDRVVPVAPTPPGEAARVMDAAGCMVAPGFIEMMTGRAAARLELATCQAPQRYAAGIRWVWVNGGVVLEAGPFQVRPTGRVLAPAR